jgi:hypothetical protein
MLPAHFGGHGGFRVEKSGGDFRIVGWAGLTAV